jgi:putative PEP-CTERM system TPR-repeat lipoprotein
MHKTRFSPRHLRCFAKSLCLAFGLISAPFHAIAANDVKAGQYYEDALTRYEKNDIRGAILQLKNALQIDKSILPAQVLLGKALLANGEVAAAEVAFNEAIRLGVNRAEVIVPLAQAMVAQGKQSKMLEQLKVDGLPSKTRFDLLIVRATAYADIGNDKEALKALEEARRTEPLDARGWTTEIPLRVRARQYREVALALEKAQALSPQSPEVIYQGGTILHIQGDLAGALAAYDKTLDLTPKNQEARISRAGLRLDLGRLDEARQDAEIVREQSPGEPRGAYLLAIIAEQQKDPGATKKWLTAVTSLIDPVPLDFIRYQPQLLMMNGLAHHGLGEPAKAKAYLENFQRVQPGTPLVKLLAQIKLSENNPKGAASLLEEYLKAQPKDAQAKSLLASAYIGQGLHQKAAQLMQEALQQQESPMLRTTLGISLLNAGDGKAGISELEAAFRKDPRQTQAGVTLATIYLKRGEHAKATAIAQALANQEPKNTSFLNLLGLSRAAARNMKEAREAFEKALAIDPDLAPTQLNLAQLEIKSREFESAEKRLLTLLKKNEKNPDILLVLSQLALASGREKDARQWLEKAADHEANRQTRAGLRLVTLHMQAGRIPEAVVVAKSLTLKTPEDITVLLTYAKVQLAAGDNQSARSALSDAARYAGYNPRSQTEIAALQLAAGDLAGAQYSTEKALSSQPDNFTALALATEIELRQGELDKAERRAKGIIEKFPKRGAGHMLLADVLRARKQNAAALESDRTALRIEPGTMPLIRVFNAQWQQNESTQAQKLAEDWLRKHPDDLVVHRALANGYARLGQLALARKAYEGLLKKNPDDTDALNNLANILLLQKDPSALAMAEKSYQADPSNPNAIDTLGWALFSQGQNDRALTLLRDARLRAPNNPEIRYHLAQVLAKTGRVAEAREEINGALRISTQFDQAEDAKRLLKQLQ